MMPFLYSFLFFTSNKYKNVGSFGWYISQSRRPLEWDEHFQSFYVFHVLNASGLNKSNIIFFLIFTKVAVGPFTIPRLWYVRPKTVTYFFTLPQKQFLCFLPANYATNFIFFYPLKCDFKSH